MNFARMLREARKKKGISQGALSSKTGIPQSHISKIESGTVDLRISALNELSRNLDLELMLVPRQLVPTFKALLSDSGLKDQKQIPVYQLTEEENDEE